ncbi:MAG: TolC family protein [Acidobacteriota bacterium]
MPLHAFTGFLPVLFAVSGAGAAPTVTEAELLARLRRDAPAVVSIASDLPRARAALLDARALPNPVLELTHEDPGDADAQTEWRLTWQLPSAARRFDVDAAQTSIEAATARFDHRVRALRARVREAYADWAVAAARHARLATAVAQLESLTARERARADRGESSGLDARRLQLAATTLDAQRALEAAALRRARGAIQPWWPDLHPDAQPILPTPSSPCGDASSDRAHPRVAALRADARAAALTREARSRFVEAPALTIGWLQQDAAGVDPHGPVVGVTWSAPLFDRRRGARLAAEARASALQADADLAAQEIAAQRADARARCEALTREAVAARDALQSNADMRTAAETAFRYGELPLTDLLDVERATRDAHLAWLALHAAALTAHRELDALAPAASHHTFDPTEVHDP